MGFQEMCGSAVPVSSSEASPAEDQGLAHPASLITPIKPQSCLHSMYLVTYDFQEPYYFSVFTQAQLKVRRATLRASSRLTPRGLENPEWKKVRQELC